MPWFAQAFPGDAYSHSNPIKAALAVPPEAWAQVVLFCGVMEWSRSQCINHELYAIDATSTRITG